MEGSDMNSPQNAESTDDASNASDGGSSSEPLSIETFEGNPQDDCRGWRASKGLFALATTGQF